MQHLKFRYIDRKIIAAATLGILALVANAVSYYVSAPEHLIPIGNVFLFCAASALGLTGALLAAATGLLPELFWSGDFAYGFRVLTLLVVIGWCAERAPRVPSFIITQGLWILVFGPLHFFAVYNGLVAESDTFLPYRYLPAQLMGAIFCAAMGDVILTLVSAVVLLIPSVWIRLTNKPLLIFSQSVLVPVITLLTSTASLITLLIVSDQSIGDVPSLTLSGVVAILLLGTVIPAGLAFWLSSRLRYLVMDPLPSSGGRPHGFSGLSSEFWRRKSSSALIPTRSSGDSGSNLSRPQQASSLSLSDRGICALKRDGTITFINRKFLSLVDCKSQEVLGKLIGDIEMHSQVADHINQLVSTTFAKGPRVTELKLNQQHNKVRFYEISSVRADSLENSSIAHGADSIVILARDITERRSVESHLLDAQRVGSLGNLVGGIAHAFDTALSTIRDLAKHARSEQDRGAVDSAMDTILDTAQDAGALVRQLLNFAEGRPSQIDAPDFGSLIDERIGLLRQMVGNANELVFERCDEKIPVTCDPNLVMQAITNLVLNSRDSYGTASGKIQITLDTEHLDEDVEELHVGAKAGDFARLRVRDSGGGMTPEILAHAFDPLFTTRSTTGHSGLGLSIVFAIVRAHDGFLTVESKPDRGTTVSIYLPKGLRPNANLGSGGPGAPLRATGDKESQVDSGSVTMH